MAGLLRAEDYPPQDAPPPAAAQSRSDALRLGNGIAGEDCRYGDDIYQRIALFVPPRPNGTVLAYMHGGGWTSGFKELMTFMAPGFMETGVIFASLGYRLAPAHLFPTGYEDAARAVAWLHGHVAGYGGDPKRLFVGGHSTGGHYAALLAVRQDWQKGLGLPQNVVRGCLPVSGVYDLTETGGLSARPRFLEPPGSGSDRAASPIMHIAPNPPPFLIAHGTRDFPHLMKQADAMVDALRKAGGETEKIVFDGCDHFQASLATADAAKPWRRRSVDWMMAH